MERALRKTDLYEALFDDGAFEQLPQRLADDYGARSAVIHWHFRDGSAAVLAHSRHFTDEQMMRYADEFATSDPWAAATAGGISVNHAVDLEQFVAPHDYENSHFYNEYILPMGDDTFRCMGVRIENEWGSGMIALQRGRTQPSFETSAVKRLDAIVPTLRRVLTIRGRLAAKSRLAAELECAFDRLMHPLILVRADGSVVHFNQATGGLFAPDGPVAIANGVLTCAHRTAARQLERAIAKAAAADAAAALVTLPRKCGPPLVVTVAPGPRNGTGGALAILYVDDPEQRGRQNAKKLRAMFGLSASEIDVALRLAHGLSVREIAEARQSAVGTVRQQIKSIASKMGCSRQSEIVAIILSLAPLLP